MPVLRGCHGPIGVRVSPRLSRSIFDGVEACTASAGETVKTGIAEIITTIALVAEEASNEKSDRRIEMGRHTVTIQEVEEILDGDSWKRCASSFGKGSNKRLEVNNKMEFRVISHNITRFLGRDVEVAIEAYNEAP